MKVVRRPPVVPLLSVRVFVHAHAPFSLGLCVREVHARMCDAQQMAAAAARDSP